jgi:hypothetical protein
MIVTVLLQYFVTIIHIPTLLRRNNLTNIMRTNLAESSAMRDQVSIGLLCKNDRWVSTEKKTAALLNKHTIANFCPK